MATLKIDALFERYSEAIEEAEKELGEPAREDRKALKEARTELQQHNGSIRAERILWRRYTKALSKALIMAYQRGNPSQEVMADAAYCKEALIKMGVMEQV